MSTLIAMASCLAAAAVLLVLALPACAAAPAPAPPTAGRPWQTMKYGLFVHHVYGGEFGNLTPLGPDGGYARDIDDFVARFNVERFADDVKAMGFEYVIFTAWHANMNALYPSQRMAKWRGPGHATTSRDLLGEIIDALIARGIRPALYTHIWVGEDFHPEGRGYYRYDKHDGIVTEDMRRTGYYPSAHTNDASLWNDFINDIYDEMCARYGDKIDAMYFDGSWSWKIDKKRLMATIRKYNRDCAFIANGNADHGFEFCSKEVGSPEAKEYGFGRDNPVVSDRDVTTWPGYERHVAIIQGSNWWASPGGKVRFDAESAFRYTVLQSGTCTTGGGVGWAFGTHADGTWEGGVLETMTRVNALLAPIAESVKNTTPSPSYPTPEKTPIGKLEHGIIATRSADGRHDYLHVLRPPAGRTLKLPLPKDGRRFASATMLRSGQSTSITQTDLGVEIAVPEDWDALDTVIRLTSQDAPPEHQPASRTWSPRGFGAVADGKTLDTLAIQKAIDAADAAGGGTVRLTAGTYRSGSIDLRSNVTLHLDAGAEILASAKLADYRRGHWTALLMAKDQQNIAITGEGTLNGNSPELSKEFERIRTGGSALEFFPTAVRGQKIEYYQVFGGRTELDPYQMEAEGKLMSFVYHMPTRPTESVRPQIIEFKGCKGVTLRGITLRDSSNWVQTYRDCEDVLLDSVTVRSTRYWNNDGLDLVDCRRVRVLDCDIDSADDALCLKSEPHGAGCEDITIERVRLASRASALKFGTASHQGFRRIRATDLTIRDTYRSAIAFQAVDGAVIEDVVIERVRATNMGNAIALRLGHRNQRKPPGTLRGIVIRDVDVQVRPEKPGEHMDVKTPHNPIPSSIVGIPGHRVTDVLLEDVRVRFAGGGTPEKAQIRLDALDSVPENERGYPEFSMWGELPAWGLYVRYASGITLRNVRLSLDTPDFRPAMVADDAPGLAIDGLQVGPGGGEPVIVLNDSPDAKVDGLQVPGNTRQAVRRLP